MNDQNPEPDETVAPEVTDAEAENSKLATTDPDEKPHFDSAPAEYPANVAHPVDENPLEHVGDEEPDPWAGKEA